MIKQDKNSCSNKYLTENKSEWLLFLRTENLPIKLKIKFLVFFQYRILINLLKCQLDQTIVFCYVCFNVLFNDSVKN